MPTHVDFTFNGPFVNENRGDVINEAAEAINISYTNGNNNTISHGSKQISIGSSHPSSSPLSLEGSHPHPMIEASAQDAGLNMRSLSDTPYNGTWLDYPMQDACASSRPPLPRKSEMPLYIDPSARARVPSLGLMSMSGGPSTSPYSDNEVLWTGFSDGDTSNSESPWSAFPPQDTPALELSWSSSPDEGLFRSDPDHHALEHQHDNLPIMPYNHQNHLLPQMEGEFMLHSQQQVAQSSMGRYFPDILPSSMVPSFPGGVIQSSTFHHNLNSYPSSNNQSISHTVNGTSINRLEGDVYNFDAASDPLRLLKDVAILDATHNAEARKPLQLNVHPSTRTKPLAAIRTWFQSKENVSPVFWLSGGVGVGKSAIAQRICDEFHNEGTLAASFFFSHTQDNMGSNSVRVLVCTLVYQLALLSKATGMKLRKLLHQYPNLLEHSAEDIFEQFLKLLGEADEESTPKLIVIDGLEKCHDAQSLPAQARVLHMINKFIGNPNSTLFRFLLCSRTDDQIRDYNASLLMVPVHFEVGGHLDDTIQEDIECFLGDRFTALSARLPGFRVSADDIKTLTRRAGNQFIYAQAVVDHVNQTGLGLSPRTLLQGVLNLRRRSINNPYEGLDSLYREILSKITEWEWRPLLRLILTPPLNSGSGSGYPTQPGPNGETLTLERRENIVTHRTCWLLANSLGLEADDIRMRLAQLESVVCGRKKNEVYDDHTSIIFRHVSFVEFLTSPHRSHDFCIERLSDAEVHDLLAQGCLRRASEYCSHYMSPENLKDQLKKDGRYKKNSAEMGKNVKEWTFDGHALNYWLHHCKRSSCSPQVVEALNEFDPYAYIATGLRMGNWREPWYNPSRYQERTELVWEWIHHLDEALEWVKTLAEPPLLFIRRCNELLWSGSTVSLPYDTPDGERRIETMKIMLTFFVATARFSKEQRAAVYEYWVEKLPEDWRLKAEDFVEQAGSMITLRHDTPGNSAVIWASRELRDGLEGELRFFVSPRQLKGQKRAYSRILRSTIRDESEVLIVDEAVRNLKAQFDKIAKMKGPKLAERRRSALEDCGCAAGAFLEWIEGLDHDSKKATDQLSEDLRRIRGLAEYDIVAYGKQVGDDSMIE
ncbi:hypothetical protein VNI00_012904 [Paramarasmius palmivorus]|uniref:Nephrocystin 3-like N-terminal domain-containing protein n=1 Tax=Paramarasmius palmivorus TaxID=297713 RepID=A0AAW0BZG8_9AGAR